MPYLETRAASILFVVLLSCATPPPSSTFGAEPAKDPKEASAGKLGSVSGRVVRAVTSEPAFEADVRLVKRPPDHFTLPLEPKRVRSNKEGAFTFDGLEPGTYLVYAFLDNESSRENKFGFQKVVIDEQLRQTKPVDLQLKPGVTLRLRITSQLTGKPLPTAKLGFVWTDGDDVFRANDLGEIVVPALTPQDWHLEITAPGHACDIRDVRLAGPETVIAIGLAPGGEVTGRVIDEKGGPLPGAKLFAQAQDQLMYTLDKTTANEKGEFRLQYLPIGTPLRLGISHPGFDRFDTNLSVASQDPVSRGNLQLTPLAGGGTVTGQVVDNAGRPVAGVTVENQGMSSENQNTTHSDARGRFTIPRLYVHVANRILLTVRAKGFAPRQVDITDNPRNGAELLQIVLEPGHRIRGRVVNHADQPIAGCRVYFAEANRASSIGGRIDADSEGRFESDSLPSVCPFAFYAPGYSELEVPTLPLDQIDEVVVRLEPIGLVRGQVVDAATGQPVSEFNVRITFPSQRQLGDNKSPGITSTRRSPGEDFIVPNGQFELKDLTNGGVWDVIVRSKKYRPTRLVSVQAAAASDAKMIDVKLRPLATGELFNVGGIIMGPDGNPAPSVQVRLIGFDKQADAPLKEQLFTPSADETSSGEDPGFEYDEFRSAVTNARGEFRFDNVPQDLVMRLVYWSDTVPVTRLDDLETTKSEDLKQLRLTHQKPVIVRATIDRQAFPDATTLSLHGRRSKGVRSRTIALKEGQSSVELSGVEAGAFHVLLMGKSEPDGDSLSSFRTKSIASKSVTAKEGDVIEVNFDGSGQR